MSHGLLRLEGVPTPVDDYAGRSRFELEAAVERAALARARTDLSRLAGTPDWPADDEAYVEQRCRAHRLALLNGGEAQ